MDIELGFVDDDDCVRKGLRVQKVMKMALIFCWHDRDYWTPRSWRTEWMLKHWSFDVLQVCDPESLLTTRSQSDTDDVFKYFIDSEVSKD